jgi:hypothetical protein
MMGNNERPLRRNAGFLTRRDGSFERGAGQDFLRGNEISHRVHGEASDNTIAGRLTIRIKTPK